MVWYATSGDAYIVPMMPMEYSPFRTRSNTCGLLAISTRSSMSGTRATMADSSRGMMNSPECAGADHKNALHRTPFCGRRPGHRHCQPNLPKLGICYNEFVRALKQRGEVSRLAFLVHKEGQAFACPSARLVSIQRGVSFSSSSEKFLSLLFCRPPLCNPP